MLLSSRFPASGFQLLICGSLCLFTNCFPLAINMHFGVRRVLSKAFPSQFLLVDVLL